MPEKVKFLLTLIVVLFDNSEEIKYDFKVTVSLHLGNEFIKRITVYYKII